MRDAVARFAGSTHRAGAWMGWRLPGVPNHNPVDPFLADRSGALAAGPLVSRIRTKLTLGFLAPLVLGVVLLGPPAAHAAYIHKPAGGFNLPPSGGNPGAIAVDEETGDVYVAHYYYPEAGIVEKFDAEGNPVSFLGLPGPNERQTIRFEGGWATGDTFTLTCPNSETTGAIEWVENEAGIQATVKAGLEAKCGGTFTIKGYQYYLEVLFEGSFAHTNVPKMTCTRVSGAGTCEVTEETNGAPETNAIRPPWQENDGDQIAVDNTGGPTKGPSTCRPSVR